MLHNIGLITILLLILMTALIVLIARYAPRRCRKCTKFVWWWSRHVENVNPFKAETDFNLHAACAKRPKKPYFDRLQEEGRRERKELLSASNQ